MSQKLLKSSLLDEEPDEVVENVSESGSESDSDEEYDTSYEVVDYTSFEDMNLRIKLLRGILKYGFDRPSPIQGKAIIPVLTGKDVIAQAQSGTGKTGTFCISTLQTIDPKTPVCQAIILSPTRELSEQINNVFCSLGRYEKVSTVLAIGGERIGNNRKSIRDGAVAAIGTPGRVEDLLRRKYLRADSIRLFVLDEADELLNENFMEQIQKIVSYLPSDCQICIFSATLSPKILDLTSHFMKKPIRILVKPEKLTLDGIKQFYVNVEKEIHKFDTLTEIYRMFSVAQTIIYTNSVKKSEWLHEQVESLGFKASLMHGQLDKSIRNEVMRTFRTGETRILVTTDLLCRGIDVEHVSIVINYDLPRKREAYIHRIGRSGRFGKKGVAINFITDYDSHQLRHLQKHYNTKINPLPKDIKEFL